VSPATGVAEPTSELGGTRGIYDTLAEAAGDGPDRVFLSDGGTDVTYAQLLARADVAAARVAALGIGVGSRVVLWLPNGADFAELFFACARVGAVAVMAGTRLRAIDIRHILDDSGAAALVFAPRFLSIDYDAMVETAVRGRGGSGAPVHLLSTQPSVAPGARLLAELPVPPAPPVFRDAEAPAVVCYTSGTTGRPKGCVHSHTALVRNGSVAAALIGLSSDDRIVCPVPFAHVFGFHMGVLQTTLAGATLVNAEPYDPQRLLDVTEASRGTVLYGVPTMAREALAAQRDHPRDVSSLRVALIAGAPVPTALRSAIRAPDGLDCDVSVVYGCTESPTLTQLTPAERSELALESVGRPTAGVELRIFAAGKGDVQPTGEVGEIAVRGYNCMLGYLGDPEATAAKHREGWLVTGDLGWLDADGYLHLVGRTGEMFLVGGFNAYPREIEAQLEQLDGVLEAAVVGVPDERLGWVPMAWVTVSGAGLGEQDVLAWAAAELASYKRPRYVKVVESLPRTSNGKLSRVKLEQLARRALPQLAWEGRGR
jgi:acyl-CoA synthetase (AMP-forming)/AMP-acid ligase II